MTTTQGKNKAEPAVPVAQSTAVVDWDAELALQASVSSAVEAATGAGGSNMFGLAGGILTWRGEKVPGNQMLVVILDSIFENVYYEGAYNPDVPASPKCFAFARASTTLAPHEQVVSTGDAQHEACTGCPKNAWGSANTGKGKACRNTRRLALISAGTIQKGDMDVFETNDEYAASPVGYLKLPVTSVAGYSGYIQQLANTLRRPQHAVVSLVSVTPDSKSQFKVTFTPVCKVPDAAMATVMSRHKDALLTTDFPYTPVEFEEPVVQPTRKTTRKY